MIRSTIINSIAKFLSIAAIWYNRAVHEFSHDSGFHEELAQEIAKSTSRFSAEDMRIIFDRVEQIIEENKSKTVDNNNKL